MGERRIGEIDKELVNFPEDILEEYWIWLCSNVVGVPRELGQGVKKPMDLGLPLLEIETMSSVVKNIGEGGEDRSNSEFIVALFENLVPYDRDAHLKLVVNGELYALVIYILEACM